MVYEIKVKSRKIYECASCGLFYATRKWAEKCEDHCYQNGGASSPEIAKHAVRVY